MAPAQANDDVELPGILLNETRTVAGRDFYSYFAARWADYDTDSQYTLTIVERPSPTTGSQISIKYAGRVVFQRFISNQSEANHKVAQQAVQQVSHMVGQLRPDVQEVMEQLFPDPDLAPNEIRLY